MSTEVKVHEVNNFNAEKTAEVLLQMYQAGNKLY